MPTTTVSSKGQITLPAALLRERHLTPGTRLEVVATANAIVLVRVEGSLVDHLAGATGGTYGDANEYVEEQRADWSDRH